MRRLPALLTLCLLVAGCGSSGGGGGSGGKRDGRSLFAGTCGGCHTLEDAGTNGSFGPDLDHLHLSTARVRAQIQHGGGGMPAGLLDGADADRVAVYVAGASSR